MSTGQFLKQQSKIQLSEYITQVSISPQRFIAASSAAGEVVLWSNDTLITLREATEQSIDCLGFSTDGTYLAAGGLQGKMYVWHIQNQPQLIATIDCKGKWLEHLAWHPQKHLLAFGWGRYVQVWQFPQNEIITTIAFEESSVLGMAWRPPQGEELVLVGNQGIKFWHSSDWDNDPEEIRISTAVLAMAFSKQGQYLAANCLDQSISLFEWGNPDPWILHGFPGKVRQLAWSDNKNPLLAMSTQNEIVVWKRSKKPEEGWKAEILPSVSQGNIEALAFAPSSDLLASVNDDGDLYLWLKGKDLGQILEGVSSDGFSCLTWSSDAQQLVTGSVNGDLIIWKNSQRGKGFG